MNSSPKTNKMNFTNRFEKYEFPLWGFIKAPTIVISPEEAKEAGLNEKCTNEEYLRALVYQGKEKKLSENKIPLADIEIYNKRIEEELGVLESLHFCGYLLIIYRLTTYCRVNDILTSPGRGSAAGCLCLWLIGVTGVNPLRHSLLFSRFISATRVKTKMVDGELYVNSENLPDYDADIQKSKKKDVEQYLYDLYPNRAVSICTLGTYTGKILIKDVLKVYEEMHESGTKEVSDLLEKVFGVVEELGKASISNEKFKEWAKNHQESVEIAQKLENLCRNKGVHPAGILICDKPFLETLPCENGKVEGTGEQRLASSFDLASSGRLALKVDLLGVRTLDVVSHCLKQIGKTLDDIPIDDLSVFQYLNTRKEFHGLFQINKGLGSQTVQGIRPINIDELGDCISLGRPGPLRFIPDYQKNKGLENNDRFGDPRIAELLKSTRNLCIYQENLMSLAMKMADFTPEEAGKINKIFSKKKVEEIPQWEPKFREGALKNGYSEATIKDIWQTFVDSGNYLFNKCLGGDTLVQKKDGFIVIKDVKPGDWIKAYNVKENRDHFVKVLNTYEGKRILYKTTLKGGKTIESSLEHKFLTVVGKMAPLYEIILNNNEIVTNTGFDTVDFYERLGELPCYDLEVMHEDHNFYANGIVGSNSHGISYAYLTSVCVFLKANFSTQFFLSLLESAKHAPEPLEEITLIAMELPYFGIKLLPPNLQISKMEFTIEGPNIRFGLSSIKGIHEKTIEKLYNFQGHYNNKFEIFQAAQSAKIPINVLAALIQAGAFNDEPKRSFLVYEAQVWNELGEKEKALALTFGAQFDYKLVPILQHLKTLNNDKGKPLIKPSRFDTLKRDCQKYKDIYNQNNREEDFANWYYEKTLLGFTYGKTLKDIFSKKISNLTYIKEIEDGFDNQEYTFVGTIKEAKTGLTKNKLPYVRFAVADERAVIQVLICDSKDKFGKVREKVAQCQRLNNGLPKEDDIVIVNGKKSKDIVFGDMVTCQSGKIYTKYSQLKRDKEKAEKDLTVQANGG